VSTSARAAAGSSNPDPSAPDASTPAGDQRVRSMSLMRL